VFDGLALDGRVVARSDATFDWTFGGHRGQQVFTVGDLDGDGADDLVLTEAAD
jgi:hypothetical protein